MNGQVRKGKVMKKIFQPKNLWKFLLLGFIPGILGAGIAEFSCSTTTNNPTLCSIGNGISTILIIPSAICLFIWIFSGWAGVYLLWKKGYFANNRFSGCVAIVLFLLIGWWLFLIVWELMGLAGAFFYLYAGNKPSKPRCPKCLSWNELGATKCKFCTSDIPPVQ